MGRYKIRAFVYIVNFLDIEMGSLISKKKPFNILEAFSLIILKTFTISALLNLFYLPLKLQKSFNRQLSNFCKLISKIAERALNLICLEKKSQMCAFLGIHISLSTFYIKYFG